MPTLNLLQLLEGDSISILVDKINTNFNQLQVNGGGPQGHRGEQGPPGLPGLKGKIGSTGDDGQDAKQVTIVGDDPNWGISYSGVPLGPIPGDANAAVAAGYNVGDIWIDNVAGIFYDIHESSPGIYDFVPHPISPAALSTGDLWVEDTDSNATVDDAAQGIRNKNRFITLSLTSQLSNAAPTIGDSAPYSDLNTIFSGNNPDVGGYPRKAYKLSIDNAHDTEFVRVSANSTGISTRYGRNNDTQSPLVYLGTSTSDDTQSDAFGFLIDTGTDTLLNYVSVLTLSSSGAADQFYVDAYKLGTNREIYYKPTSANDNAYIRFMDILPDGSRTAGVGNSFWLGVGSMSSGIELPYPGAVDHENLFGIEQRLYHNGGTRAGKINFYSSSNGNLGGSRFIMSLTDTGAVTIGANVPSSSLSANDDTQYARLLVHAKTVGGTGNQLDANTAWFMPAQSIANTNHGSRMVLGFQDYTGSVTVGDYISTISSEYAPIGVATPTPLVMQPNSGGNFSVSDSNATLARLSVGELNPNARLTVSGNMTVGNTAWTTTYTPPSWGALIDKVLGIGDNDPARAFGHRVANDMRLFLGSVQATNATGNAYQVIYSQDATKSAGIWFNVGNTASASSWSAEVYQDHFLFGRKVTNALRSLVTMAFDANGRIGVGGTVAGGYLADSIPYATGYSDGILMHLRNISAAESSTTNGIQTIMRLETSSDSLRIGTYTTSAEPRDLTTGAQQFGPEIQFKGLYSATTITTTIKQGWANDNRTFLTPNGVGKGGHIAAFSDDTIDKVFTDDWQVRQNYAPTSDSGNPYYTPSSITPVTDIIVKHKNDAADGTLVTPASVPLGPDYEVTQGAHNSSGPRGIVNYTFPSRVTYKKLNERFVLLSFRLGIYLPGTGLTAPGAGVLNSDDYYANLFAFTVQNPIMTMAPHSQYARSSSLPTTAAMNTYQDFPDGWWYSGSCYSSNAWYTTTGGTGDQNLRAAPNLVADASAAIVGSDYAQRPVPPLVRNTVAPYLPIRGNSMNMSWTVSRFKTSAISAGLLDKMNIFVSLPQSIFLLSSHLANAQARQIYFVGNAVLDAYDWYYPGIGGTSGTAGTGGAGLSL